MENKAKRIVWVDIYKALAITLVVIGHATGLFNRYIYQFHIPAFFFISGYVANQDRDSLGVTVVRKAYMLLLPLFVFIIIFAGFMEALNRGGYYGFWFGELDYEGFWGIIRQFARHGNIYAWWLGPAWFVVILFFVSVISRALWMIACTDKRLYGAYIILLYVAGYILSWQGTLMPGRTRIVLIAQFFYGCGFLMKKINCKKIEDLGTVQLVVGLVLTAVTIYGCGMVPNVTVDYSVSSFGNIGLNTLTGMVGIVWLCCLATVLGKIPNKCFIRICTAVGQNTMGIMLLHFTVFRMVSVLLYFLDLAEYSEIARITPSDAVGRKYWLLFVVISEVISLFAWNLFKRIPVFRVLIGADMNKATDVLKYIRKHSKIVAVTVLIGGYVLLGCYGIRQMVLRHIQIQQPLDVRFPNSLSEDIVRFEGGWQTQGDEEWRWIADQGTVIIYHENTKRILVSGYVPDDFFEVTQLEIFVNGQCMDVLNFSENRGFEVTYDVSQFAEECREYEIVFDFDGVHEPENGNGEIRSLSGLINRIRIE